MADENPMDHLYRRETMNLTGLSADELTARLKGHVGGGLVFPTGAEIDRGCVRRARQVKAADLAALELLDDLRRLCGLGELPELVRGDDGGLRTVTPGWRPVF